MKALGIVAALAAVAMVTPASAKQDFASYEGPDAVQTGTGGAKISKNGIDYWTQGTPPRKFKVIGILTDARKDRAFDGNVIGSKSVAEKTLAAGGDAVIVGPGSTRSAGVVGGANFWNTGGGNGFVTAHGRQINRTTTQLVVIKYLEQAQ